MTTTLRPTPTRLSRRERAAIEASLQRFLRDFGRLPAPPKADRKTKVKVHRPAA